MSTTDWKMKLAAILAAIAGVCGTVLHYLDPAQGITIEQGIATVIGSFAVFGMADKLQKLIKK